MVVPANQGSTVANVGDEAESGVAQGGIAPAAVERGAETAHRRGELPERGFSLGGGASPRCSHQRVVQVATSVSYAGGHRRRICPGGGRRTRAVERGGASTRTAQYLNSGIFPNGSSVGFARIFVAAST